MFGVLVEETRLGQKHFKAASQWQSFCVNKTQTCRIQDMYLLSMLKVKFIIIITIIHFPLTLNVLNFHFFSKGVWLSTSSCVPSLAYSVFSLFCVFILFSAFRHRAPVHRVLPGGVWPLREAVHVGHQVLSDGAEGSGRCPGHQGRSAASHDGSGTADRDQEDTGEDLPLRQTPARYAFSLL